MGPLKGLRVIEIEGLGPAPFCGMLLADMGAEVISITRKSSDASRAERISERGKKSVALNLKSTEGVETLLSLCDTADVLIEGFRPGVAERLGFGPEVCSARNPKLVYGRMTGWGQTGPLASAAGHDINYIALSGALHGMGRKGEKPVPPLNLVGDFGGGSMFLVMGILAAIYEAKNSGQGQVVDVSMVEGAANLMHLMYTFLAEGTWQDERGVNLLDGAAHFYDTYETADGKYVSIGPIEPQFYALFLDLVGLDQDTFGNQNDSASWEKKSELLTEVFKQRSRDEWCELLEGTDVCFAPVLSMLEAPLHPHNVERKTFLELEGVLQPAPAPRFSRTPSAVPKAPRAAGSDSEQVLRDSGYSEEKIAELRELGVLV
ncbi:CoA transferase [Spongiibacter sp. KMU-166]|uniref:CoA transferase n=1 Tax=Spongiibacter thalassae TaxID=2721624 RepID=A0ABX1GAF2_9GAMM|nr:CoA transferase [Spongiibacter thalassae]